MQAVDVGIVQNIAIYECAICKAYYRLVFKENMASLKLGRDAILPTVLKKSKKPKKNSSESSFCIVTIALKVPGAK